MDACMFFLCLSSPGITCELLLSKCAGVPGASEAHSSRPQHANDFGGLAGERKGRGVGLENVNGIYSLSLHIGENTYITAPSAEKNPPEISSDPK